MTMFRADSKTIKSDIENSKESHPLTHLICRPFLAILECSEFVMACGFGLLGSVGDEGKNNRCCHRHNSKTIDEYALLLGIALILVAASFYLASISVLNLLMLNLPNSSEPAINASKPKQAVLLQQRKRENAQARGPKRHLSTGYQPMARTRQSPIHG